MEEWLQNCCYFLLNFSLDTTYGGPMDPAISPHSLGYSRIDLERWPSLKSRVNEFIGMAWVLGKILSVHCAGENSHIFVQRLLVVIEAIA